MDKKVNEFKKNKEFLVCVDSDGCAMDTMEVKHRKCFGPKIVEVWGLHDIQDELLNTWYKINLYSKTRGINRFKGLVTIFEVLSKRGINVPKFNSIKNWVETSPELSNPALIKAIEETKDEQLIKALEWSNSVNESIKSLVNEDKPFKGVKEGLEAISEYVDIAIVSSANRKAVIDEWTRHDIISKVNIICGQEDGTKATCIFDLKKDNFSNYSVLMVGDALGDLEAAEKNDVLYYPIIVGKEDISWNRLVKEAIPKLLDGSYKGEYQDKLIDEFNLSLV